MLCSNIYLTKVTLSAVLRERRWKGAGQKRPWLGAGSSMAVVRSGWNLCVLAGIGSGSC